MPHSQEPILISIRLSLWVLAPQGNHYAGTRDVRVSASQSTRSWGVCVALEVRCVRCGIFCTGGAGAIPQSRIHPELTTPPAPSTRFGQGHTESFCAACIPMQRSHDVLELLVWAFEQMGGQDGTGTKNAGDDVKGLLGSRAMRDERGVREKKEKKKHTSRNFNSVPYKSSRAHANDRLLPWSVVLDPNECACDGLSLPVRGGISLTTQYLAVLIDRGIRDWSFHHADGLACVPVCLCAWQSLNACVPAYYSSCAPACCSWEKERVESFRAAALQHLLVDGPPLSEAEQGISPSRQPKPLPLPLRLLPHQRRPWTMGQRPHAPIQ